MLLPLVVALMIAPQDDVAADPLAPARAGMLQCYGPDAAKKSCTALAGYARNGTGFTNRAEVRLSLDANPLITLTTTTQVRIERGMICGKVAQADLDSAEPRLNHVAMEGEQRAQVLKGVSAAYTGAGILGHEVCTRYVPEGDTLSAQVQVDGVPRPQFTQRVRWVKADEGYTVQ
jgi:hypothetical protein